VVVIHVLENAGKKILLIMLMMRHLIVFAIKKTQLSLVLHCTSDDKIMTGVFGKTINSVKQKKVPLPTYQQVATCNTNNI
jgi:hypothetical protein